MMESLKFHMTDLLRQLLKFSLNKFTEKFKKTAGS